VHFVNSLCAFRSLLQNILVRIASRFKTQPGLRSLHFRILVMLVSLRGRSG
jgi:hypothetical protein